LAQLPRIPDRNCLKSLDGRKTKALEAYETGQRGSFRYGMLAISALETPLSDFLDSLALLTSFDEAGSVRLNRARSEPVEVVSQPKQ
jgi:hypothetical protein